MKTTMSTSAVVLAVVASLGLWACGSSPTMSGSTSASGGSGGGPGATSSATGGGASASVATVSASSSSSSSSGSKPVCGDGHVDPGETCDGDCPTSCPPSTVQCTQNVLIGSASTCDAACVVAAVTGCVVPMCPLNGAPSSQVGPGVFKGSFLDPAVQMTPIQTGCLPGSQAVYAWRAPQDAVYTFVSGGVRVETSFGMQLTSMETDHLIVGLGASCATAVFPTCPFPGVGKAYTVALTAGEDVLIAASEYVESNTVKADYSIDISMCTPACAGRTCGDDGCGGSCGACAAGLTCTGAGACACVPACGGRDCGADGCGGSCGTCPMGSACDAAGQCVCTPSCAGLSCGGDGCGGSCGACALGKSCSGGACVADPNACDPVSDLGCTPPNGCWVIGAEKTTCALPGTGVQGDACATTSSCAGGFGCFGGQCRKFCDIQQGTGCPAGLTCTGITGWTHYGACQ